MASTWLSIAVGAGGGAVKGWILTSGGRVGSTMVMQFVVIEEVALGFMRRMLIVGVAILDKSFAVTVRLIRPRPAVMFFRRVSLVRMW